MAAEILHGLNLLRCPPSPAFLASCFSIQSSPLLIMKLLSFASVLASVSVLFVDPVLSEIKATTVFETIPEGKDGSCSGRDLDTMVHEAITLNDKAIGALDSINDPNGFSLREKGHTAQMAIAMWGVQPRRTLLGFSSDGIYFNGNDLTLLNKVKCAYMKRPPYLPYMWTILTLGLVKQITRKSTTSSKPPRTQMVGN